MMSMAQSAPAERRNSPLRSNNPFRNRIPSGPPSPPILAPTSRPATKNPFLDAAEVASSPPRFANKPAPTVATAQPMALTNGTKLPTAGPVDEHTQELFDNLAVKEQLIPMQPPAPYANGTNRRPENIPPKASSRMPRLGHRATTSEEERKRMAIRPRGGVLGDLDIFADPPEASKSRGSRPRRNSESSVKDRPSKLLDPEDDKRRQERRHRDGRRREKAKQPSRKLDVIDKLDVTSIYGTGLFHHDGPFDACNPSRNRKGSRAAPMQAFPKDSSNMSIGGSGPNRSRLNLEQFHGMGQEAHKDYNKGAIVDDDAEYFRKPAVERNESFHPTARVEPLHGEETAGLGTSTFLEGAPASRVAIQRRATEDQFNTEQSGGGISRKKSIVQKIRGVRPNGARMTSPEPGPPGPQSPPVTGRSEGTVNPFFKDYDQEYERKGAQIRAVEEKVGRVRAPSSPGRGMGLERKVTAESVEGADEGKSGGGFLSRVKSLKGGRRVRTERRDVSS